MVMLVFHFKIVFFFILILWDDHLFPLHFWLYFGHFATVCLIWLNMHDGRSTFYLLLPLKLGMHRFTIFWTNSVCQVWPAKYDFRSFCKLSTAYTSMTYTYICIYIYISHISYLIHIWSIWHIWLLIKHCHSYNNKRGYYLLVNSWVPHCWFGSSGRNLIVSVWRTSTLVACFVCGCFCTCLCTSINHSAYHVCMFDWHKIEYVRLCLVNLQSDCMSWKPAGSCLGPIVRCTPNLNMIFCLLFCLWTNMSIL